jgi:hypothetical protein
MLFSAGRDGNRLARVPKARTTSGTIALSFIDYSLKRVSLTEGASRAARVQWVRPPNARVCCSRVQFLSRPRTYSPVENTEKLLITGISDFKSLRKAICHHTQVPSSDGRGHPYAGKRGSLDSFADSFGLIDLPYPSALISRVIGN